MNKLNSKKHSRGSQKQGSALITAVIFAFVVSLVMGSYLSLATNEMRIASRSFMMNCSFNLAEGGVDYAMNALNLNNDTGWNTGTHSGKTYWSRTIGPYAITEGMTGRIEVAVADALTNSPTIYAQGIVTNAVIGGDIRRQITVTLDQASYLLGNAIDSKNGFDLAGNNVRIDSYNSDNGRYNANLGGGKFNKNSEASVATIAVTDSANVGNADIYGYVATGAFAPNVGKNGMITTYGNPGVVDQSRITTDYYAEFPSISAPTVSGGNLPISGNLGSPIAAALGAKGYREYLMSGSWSNTSKDDLHIYDDVVVVTTGDISIKGNIYLHANATLKIYTSGNVDIGGKGIMNGLDSDDKAYVLPTDQKPERVQIFGTNPSAGGQSIKISGNGQFSGVIYAPNADVSGKGGGNAGMIKGAIVGNSLKFTGNTHFAYDESLGAMNLGGDGFEVNDWVEMTSVGFNTTPVNLSIYGL